MKFTHKNRKQSGNYNSTQTKLSSIKLVCHHIVIDQRIRIAMLIGQWTLTSLRLHLMLNFYIEPWLELVIQVNLFTVLSPHW